MRTQEGAEKEAAEVEVKAGTNGPPAVSKKTSKAASLPDLTKLQYTSKNTGKNLTCFQTAVCQFDSVFFAQ